MIKICSKLAGLKQELDENKHRMRRSNTFLEELEKWLHKLRHQ